MAYRIDDRYINLICALIFGSVSPKVSGGKVRMWDYAPGVMFFAAHFIALEEVYILPSSEYGYYLPSSLWGLRVQAAARAKRWNKQVQKPKGD